MHGCEKRATMETSDLASFGELLKSYRKRQRLTQQQVARQLALHHNTIGAWERGDYLPATRGMILELARCLRLTESETQTLLEASLTAVTPRWSVPYQRNPFFTGRQATLQHLHRLLSAQPGGPDSSGNHRACVLSGLAGIGKTQTALEYAYRHVLDYAAVFWISAETSLSIISGFTTIARMLKLPVEYIQNQEEVIAGVLDWLNTHQDWLLIFDNTHDIAVIKRFLPSSQNGSLLFTTRLPTLGTLAIPIELQPLSTEESVQLLLRRAGLQAEHGSPISVSNDDEKAARAIGEEMDGLPLALDQAAGYIEESHCSLADFLHLYQQNATRMLQERAATAIYHHSVEKTFTLAFERLQQQDAAAADLLTACCFLAPDEIPEALLIKGKAHLTAELQAVLSEPFRLNDAFKHLLAYALLRRNSQTATLSVHRLVQTVLKERLSEEAQRQWVARLIRMLDQLFCIEQGQMDTEHWGACEELLPHARSVIYTAVRLQVVLRELGVLVQKIATYLVQRERFELAEFAYQRALGIQERTMGPDHPDVALTLAGLAGMYDRRENYQEVEPLYRRAISLLEANLGLEHLQLVFPLRGLALFYLRMNRFKEAEEIYQRVLSICTQHLGQSHADVATALYDLALCYYNQGNYTQAEPLYLQALHIRERTLPPHHPAIGLVLNGLALLYRQQAGYHEAEQFHLRSLSIYEKTLGPEHTEVAIALNNLAFIYCEQAKYELAEPLYQRGLAISKQIFGPEDSFVARFLNNLAMLYCYQHRYEEAEAAAAHALSIYEQHFASDYLDIADPLQSLALLAYRQGRYEEADAFSSRAFAIRERALPDHPKLGSTLHLRANLCRSLGKYEEAEDLYQRALHLYRQRLEPEHLTVVPLLDDFALLLQEQERWEEVEQYYREALRIWERYQGLDHPAHADCLEHYATLLDQQQRGQEGAVYRQRAEEMRARRYAPTHIHISSEKDYTRLHRDSL